MSKTFAEVQQLVQKGEVRVSEHGYDELAADGLFVRDIVESVGNAVVIEDYPGYHRGHCVLVLQKDRRGNPIHVVWGIPLGSSTPAVIVTAYRPDVTQWEADFLRRIK